jgi:hypothetical protein
MDVSGIKGAKVESVIPLESLPYGTPNTTYVAVRIPKEGIATGSIHDFEK